MQHVLGPALGNTNIKTLKSRPDPGDGAVVVSALLIDDALKATLPLVVMVGNVRHKIGVAAFAFAHDPIFVITKVGCPQPQRVLIFEGMSRLFQRADRLLDGTTFIE